MKMFQDKTEREKPMTEFCKKERLLDLLIYMRHLKLVNLVKGPKNNKGSQKLK